MKKAVVGVALVLIALVAAPGASARATYETDVFIADVDFLKSGDILVSGALFSEKRKCESNREVELFAMDFPEKRRGAALVPLDTDTTSKGGAFGFLIPAEAFTGDGFKVKAPKVTKGDDVCSKGSDVTFIA